LKQTNKQTNKQKLPLCTGAKKGKRVHFHLWKLRQQAVEDGEPETWPKSLKKKETNKLRRKKNRKKKEQRETQTERGTYRRPPPPRGCLGRR
jgi:hypothetical protein